MRLCLAFLASVVFVSIASAQAVTLTEQQFRDVLQLRRLEAERDLRWRAIEMGADSLYRRLDNGVGVEGLMMDRALRKADPWPLIRRMDSRTVAPEGGKFDEVCSRSVLINTLGIFMYGESSLSRRDFERALATDDGKSGPKIPVPPEAIALRRRLGDFYTARGYELYDTAGGIYTYALAPDDRNFGLVASIYPTYLHVDPRSMPECNFPGGPIVSVGILDVTTWYQRTRIQATGEAFDRSSQALRKKLGDWHAIESAVSGALSDLAGADDEHARGYAIDPPKRRANMRLACRLATQIVETDSVSTDAMKSGEAEKWRAHQDLREKISATCGSLPPEPQPTAAPKQLSPAEYGQCVTQKFPEYKRLGDAYFAAQKKQNKAEAQKALNGMLAMHPQLQKVCGPDPGGGQRGR